MQRMNNVILASASPRRQQLLKEIFNDFQILPANVDEKVDVNIPVSLQPEKIAEKKAQFIAKDRLNSFVIGCDTAVIIENIILGKPKNKEDAFSMIKLLSGKCHSVITGCALCYKGKTHCFSCETKVFFNSLSDSQIENYLGIKEILPSGKCQFQWEDKAGAYGIQNSADLLVKNISGDFNNVVGLPCQKLKEEINKFLSEGYFNE